jgi:hypothetical protein
MLIIKNALSTKDVKSYFNKKKCFIIFRYIVMIFLIIYCAVYSLLSGIKVADFKFYTAHKETFEILLLIITTLKFICDIVAIGIFSKLLIFFINLKKFKSASRSSNEKFTTFNKLIIYYILFLVAQ